MKQFRAKRDQLPHYVPLRSERVWIEFILEQLEVCMSSVSGLQAAFTQLQQDTQTAVANLKSQVAALEGQIDGTAFQQLMDQVNALDATVKSADPGTGGGTPVVDPSGGGTTGGTTPTGA